MVAALAVTGLVAAGCGGGDDGGGSGSQPSNKPAKEIFAGTCGGCHTLSAAGTNGQTGPNLDERRPDKATVLAAIKAGPSIMPSNLLEGADADKVAQFVAENAGK